VFGDAFRSLIGAAPDEVKPPVASLADGAGESGSASGKSASEWLESEAGKAAEWAKQEGEAAVQAGSKAAQAAGGALQAAKSQFLKEIKGVCIPCLVKSLFPSGPSVEGATDDQKAQILKAHSRALEMIDNAVAHLQAAKTAPDPEVESYFDIAGTDADDQKKLDTLIANYEHIKSGMDSVEYQKEDSPANSDGTITAAYVKVLPVIHGVGDVHICYPGFDQGSDDDRAATIVHEMSHYQLGTEDHAYAWQDDFDTLTQEQKMDNADSYGKFAEAVSQP
jgi:hypothetical protein